MKKRICIALCCAAALFAGISCEGLRTELEVGHTEPRLVVEAIWAQDAYLYYVLIHKSQPLWTPPVGEEYYIVKDATVYLKEGNRQIMLPWNDGSYGGGIMGYHVTSAEFPLEPGQVVTLDISTTDGYHVTSTCTIPPAVSNEVQPTGMYTAKSKSGYEYTFFVDYEIKDIPGRANYYETSCFATFQGQPHLMSELFIAGNAGIFSDKKEDGGRYVFTAENDYPDATPNDSVYIYVTSISEAMFHFGRSVYAAQNSIEFFSEPTPIYTNIQGGLGIFCIYTYRRYSFAISNYMNN